MYVHIFKNSRKLEKSVDIQSWRDKSEFVQRLKVCYTKWLIFHYHLIRQTLFVSRCVIVCEKIIYGHKWTLSKPVDRSLGQVVTWWVRVHLIKDDSFNLLAACDTLPLK